MQRSNNPKQLKWRDFVAPSPFVKSWMLPYLPSNIILRDFLVTIVGFSAGVFLAILAYQYLGEIGKYVAIVLFFGFGFVFQGDARGRYYAAWIIYSREKKTNASAREP